MTNFDPGGFLVLLTVIPSVVGGALAIAGAHAAARLGYGDYEHIVLVLTGVLLAVWIGLALRYSTSMLLILSVVLAMVGAYVVTRNVAAASYGWVLGVVFLYLGFALLSRVGLYQGVDSRGAPQGLIAANLPEFYWGGLFVCGVLGGAVVAGVKRMWSE